MNNSHEKALATSENNFGELLRSTGPMAKVNPFRFSTQYQDDETDLLMYVHRPYSASQGRFLCRDTLGEEAFLKPLLDRAEESEKLEQANQLWRQSLMPPYVFVVNAPVGAIDPLGLSIWPSVDPKPTPPTVRNLADCTIEIYAGHGFLDSAFDEDGKLKDPTQNLSSRQYPVILKSKNKCSAGAIVACNAAKFVHIDNVVEGYSLIDKEINPADGRREITSVVGLARANAQEILKRCCWCKQVTISVTCSPPFSRTENPFKTSTPECGQVYVVTRGGAQ